MRPTDPADPDQTAVGVPLRRYAVLSTYPPTPCGIATFSAALCEGLATHHQDVSVVRMGDASIDAHPVDAGATDAGSPVVATQPDDGSGPTPAALTALNDADVVIVQHEYGIYGGEDGDALLGLLAEVEQPTIVVAHTVLRSPTPHQRAVLDSVVQSADAVVVMTEAGRVRLCAGFDVDPAKVTVIPHGAAVPSPTGHRRRPATPNLLTWGLLGPGKGIEWAIDALGLLGDLRPRLRYRIAGDTHPKVAESEGDAYRDMLRDRARRTGVAPYVDFDGGYRGLPALAAMIAEASLVVLPYDSPDQVTSGVLVDAVAAGCPVISTAFPHAVELLGSGAGLVVPRQDPDALAEAIRRALTEPGLLTAMATEARRLSPSLAWPAVSGRYAALGEKVLASRAAVSV